MRNGIAIRAGLAIGLAMRAGCSGSRDGSGADGRASVVEYSAQDREFGESVPRACARRTGMEVLPKFHVESTRTVGLANDIIAGKTRPRCGLFWNNEILDKI